MNPLELGLDALAPEVTHPGPALIIVDLNSQKVDPIATIAALKTDASLVGVRTIGFASHVHVLCRSNRLADTMSRYLVDRIANNPRISLRMQTEIDELSGGTHL